MPVRRVRQPDTQDLTFSTLRLVAEVKELVRELEVQASLARVGGGEPYRVSAGLVEVELDQDVERLLGPVGDDVEVGLPHVAADEADGRAPGIPEHVEELGEGLLGAVLAEPQQPLAPVVDLVDQGQVVVASVPQREIRRQEQGPQVAVQPL